VSAGPWGDVFTAEEALDVVGGEWAGCSPDVDGVEAVAVLRSVVEAARSAVGTVEGGPAWAVRLRRALDGGAVYR
jgi:hypothetical protein